MRIENLQDRSAVVTGASRGIGYHIARALLEQSVNVIITGRSESVYQTAEKLGDRCTGVVCDQRDADHVRHLAEQVEKRFGGLDLLIANAGAMGGRPVEQMTLEFWNRIIETNLTGTFLVCQALLPLIRRQGRGDVFIISSMSGKKGDPNAAAYAASKFGLQGFAQALMHEVRRDNIRVMVLNPSAVNTEPDDTGPLHGAGLRLHAADLAATIVHLAQLPGRTMVRDMDIYATNPFT